jgi:hypothetical protein
MGLVPGDPDATPTPTRAQAERAASAMLSAANATENLATRLTVARYATWRARFDGMRGPRASAGIADATLFRGSEDTVVILTDIPGLDDALAWAEGGWRTAIPAEGVQGTPAVYFGIDPSQEAADGEAAPGVPRARLKLMSHFKVYDYADWHELFLKMEHSRVGGGGMTNPSIFRGSEDGNDLLVLGDVADPAQFRAWLVEDFMTGYPAATGAARGTYRFVVELGVHGIA